MTRNNSDRYNKDWILASGIFLIIISIPLIQTAWTFKSDLIPLKGTLRSADTYVRTVTETRGRFNSKREIQVSDLIFYLNEFNKKFSLTEDIGKLKYRNEKYEAIWKGLKQTDSVTVWIKTNEIETYEPKIFQIDNAQETLLPFETVRMQDSPYIIIFLVLGLSLIALYFWLKNPLKFRKVMGIDEILPKN